MTTTRVEEVSALAAEQIVDALTDFGDNRAKRWPGSDPGRYQVHETGPTWADVTEASARTGHVWQRLRYSWETPGLVRLTALDSNAFGPGSFWEYRMTPDGAGTRVTLTVHRNPTTARGRLLDPVLAVVGRRIFGRDLRDALRALELARSDTEGASHG